MNKTIISLALIISILLLTMQSCYTSRPVGYVSTPDYNGRVEVSRAAMKKKGSGLDIVFTVGLAGAGGYAGYQHLNLVQKQTATGQEPVRTANAAIGALSGAALGYLCDAIAGKNKIVSVSNPQQWVKKANPQYKLLSGAGSSFTLIHPSAENNFTIKDINDVRDFQRIFPHSTYTDQVFRQAVENLQRDELPSLISLYPNNRHAEAAKAEYIKNSSSFAEALAATREYPLQNADELCVPLIANAEDAIDFIRHFSDTNHKKAAVINAFRVAEPTKSAMQNLKNAYGNSIYLTASDLQNQKTNTLKYYYAGMYNLTSPSTLALFDKFDTDYRWLNFPDKSEVVLSNYWNLNDQLYVRGMDVISNFKRILVNPQYEKYNLSETSIKDIMTDKLQAEVKAKVKILSQNIIGQDNSEWENWKRSPYTAGVVSDRSNVSYILYGEIQNTSKFDLPVILGGGAVLQETVKIQGNEGSGLGAIITGLVKIFESTTGQSTTQVKDVAGAVEHFYFPVILSGEKVIYSMVLDFGTQMRNMGINVLDWIKGTNELGLREVKTDIMYLATTPDRQQLKKQDEWQRMAKDGGLPAGKLTDFVRGEEVRQDIWNIRHEELQQRLREAERNATYNSYSSNDDNNSSSQQDIDPDRVDIPSYTITTQWKDRALLSTMPGDQYLEAEFTDGTKVEISRYESDKIPFVKMSTTAWDKGEYKNDDYAIKAAYVWKKYDKLRTIGKK